MKPCYYVILLAFAFGVQGCQKKEYLTEGDYFHLYNDGAKMPVWVKGNLESDVFIITLHGGPGASGHEFPLSNGFKYLEEDYALVYWDQRFSGMAQGHPDKSTINLEQFIEDTDKLVQLINQKYNYPKLFILGHSWGGQLSAAYLGRDNHASIFKGWIDLDGSIYAELEAQIMKNWILSQVPEKLADPEADQEFWQYVLKWYNENPAPDNYSDQEPYIFANALNGYTYDWEKVQENNPTPYKDLIFHSMFSMSYYVYGFGGNLKWADKLNLTPELGNIDIPALLLWGKNDGAVPASVADYVYDHLATDSTMKEVVKIDQCAHAPHFDQPEIFYQEVKNFVEQYK